ncbi:MAG: ankyrin repeat domain-containing protein [Planctomycetota bacterium]
MIPLPPLRAPLAEYEARAEQLRLAFAAGDGDALALVHKSHPHFRDPDVPWKPRELAPGELETATLDAAAARLALARFLSYRDWDALAAHVTAIATPASPVCAFELAVEALVTGDSASLEALLAAHPDLVHARSTRVTCFDPPVHRATLLHYVAANGVEAHRQKTPPNAVAIARCLLQAGAEVDALASLYGGEHTTMSLLVSSTHPAQAGVQLPLVALLLDHGADADGFHRATNVRTALLFGFVEAAELLVSRGAKVDDLTLAAGLGRTEQVAHMVVRAAPADVQAALALAAMLGHTEAVRLLLDAGADPDRYNPSGMHAHATPLHQAALAGHMDVVVTLVERGARLDQCDKIWKGRPVHWARHGGRDDVRAYLESAMPRPPS